MSYRKKLFFANATLAISIVISALFTIMALPMMQSGTGFGAMPSGLNAPAAPAQPGTDMQENDAGKSSVQNGGSDTRQDQPSAPSPGSSGGLYGPSTVPEYSSGGYGSGSPTTLAPALSGNSNSFGTMFFSPLYQSSPYIVPITWGAIAGALIWRGKVRSQWCKHGYDYDTFRLLARMKGSPIRVALLSSVTASAKTRSQLAQALSVDWKTIDNHIDVLAKNRLIQEIGSFGTSRYFAITEHGRRVLSLLLTSGDDNNVSSGPPNDIAHATKSESRIFIEKVEEETENRSRV